jgi:metallo-beta-lactamase family protein
VVQIEGLSAHADYAELIQWLEPASLSPRRVFVTHGEPTAADVFRRRLRDRFGWNAVVPDAGSTWTLD